MTEVVARLIATENLAAAALGVMPGLARGVLAGKAFHASYSTA